MGKADKTPAVYMWKNLTNGRVYIGSTKDIGKRCKQYISAVDKVKRDPEYASKHNELIRDIAKLGWEAFEFSIIDASPGLLDAHARSIMEVEQIMKHRSILPEYGYNATIGGESGACIHRNYGQHHTDKPRAVFLYDTILDRTELYLRGTLSIPIELGTKASSFPDAIQRGNMIRNRYFAYYADRERRHMFAAYISEMKDRPKFNGSNDDDTRRRYQLYMKGLKAVDEFASTLGA